MSRLCVLFARSSCRYYEGESTATAARACIGSVGADAILKARRQGKLTDLSHLRQLNICAPEQAAPYILLDGRKPMEQMSLF